MQLRNLISPRCSCMQHQLEDVQKHLRHLQQKEEQIRQQLSDRSLEAVCEIPQAIDQDSRAMTLRSDLYLTCSKRLQSWTRGQSILRD